MPINLISYECELQPKLLHMINDVLDDYLDKTIHEWFNIDYLEEIQLKEEEIYNNYLSKGRII